MHPQYLTIYSALKNEVLGFHLLGIFKNIIDPLFGIYNPDDSCQYINGYFSILSLPNLDQNSEFTDFEKCEEINENTETNLIFPIIKPLRMNKIDKTEFEEIQKNFHDRETEIIRKIRNHIIHPFTYESNQNKFKITFRKLSHKLIVFTPFDVETNSKVHQIFDMIPHRLDQSDNTKYSLFVYFEFNMAIEIHPSSD